MTEEQTAPSFIIEEDALTREQLFAKLAELQKPISVEELTDILGSTVKHDDTNKAITFLAMLLTYTAEDQVNLAFLAESSTGKSYIPLELCSYFPSEDVKEYGYVSPTAFFHDYGSYDKETHTIYINLERKIMVYLDQPHDELLKRMRALFSHDRKNIMLKITDRSEKGGTRAKNILITGYSTNIFCTCKYTMDDQEKTRQLLLSPEATQEKIREAIELRLQKEGNREAYLKAMMENPKRNKLRERIACIKSAKIDYINLSPILIEKVQKQFLDGHPHLQSRQTRDITRLLAIIKGHALLNFNSRPKTENTIEVTQEDVDTGFKLYAEVAEANELGMPPELFKVYTELKPELDKCGASGFLKRDFQKIYYEHYHKYLGHKKGDDILKTLLEVGLLNEEQDSNDKRKTRYIPQGVWVHTLNENHTHELPSVHTPSVVYSLVCPNCQAQGKEMFFSSQEDLGKHVLAIHFRGVESNSEVM